jgi:cation diffusion facilitator CzcD-associated flavoprotein CzcO
MSEGQRTARFERAWSGHGFSKWFGLPREIATNEEANRLFCDFVAAKIRARVNDPGVADKLIPKDHLFGTKRVPCETGYFETYNRDNVELISLAENPILAYTESGVHTAQGDFDFDMIVLATGFDAYTGALNRIDIRGVDGRTLQDKWKDGPKTFLGLQVHGFPNLIINGGPHGKGGIGNSPRCSECVIPWIANLIRYMAENGLDEVEAEEEAEASFTDAVYRSVVGALNASTDSYSFGSNVEGKVRAYLAYNGSLPDFARQLKEIADNGYRGFHLR